MAINPLVSDENAEGSDSQSTDFVGLEAAHEVLVHGDIELLARMPYSSNATFLVRVERGDLAVNGIYKPVKGERPLWDFPSGLHRREIAAYELSDELEWNVVPPTVERIGPHGPGSIQLFIDADFTQHYFTLVKNPLHHRDLRRLCVLDLLANNTDRKSGHCLLSEWGRVYGIDHGLCFSRDFKLRTVIWDFANEPIDDHLLEGVQHVATGAIERLAPWLDEDEADALMQRARWLSESPIFPADDGYRWPWPLI